jgi:putative ubiquitin-RnfH superfamily antitoxin RatB of RatAB toxin-antitoxin module
MAKPESVSSSLRLKVTLVYSPAPRQVREWALELAEGATVAQALAASGIFDEFPDLHNNRLMPGIWGAKTRLDHRLNDRDRIEIYRALRVDPKVARRERFNHQGAKSAGLFAKTRPGSKAGY